MPERVTSIEHDSPRRASVRRFISALGLGSLAFAALVAPDAHAESPVCQIVTDGTGGARNVPGTGKALLPNQDDLEITSGDLATNRRFLTTVVRVKDLHYVLSSAPRARQYLMYFHIGKTDYATSATRYPDGDVFWLIGGKAGESQQRVDPLGVGSNYKIVSGVFDLTRNEVRVTVPLGLFRVDGPVTRGRIISGISAATYQGVGVNTAGGATAGGEEDRSDGPPARYVIDSPSCVTPGR